MTSIQSPTMASDQEPSAVSTMTLHPCPTCSCATALPSKEASSPTAASPSTLASTEEIAPSPLSASPLTPVSWADDAIDAAEKKEEEVKWHTVGLNGKAVKPNGVTTPTSDSEGRSERKTKGQQVVKQGDYQVSGGAYSSLSVEQTSSRKKNSKKSKKSGKKKTQIATSTSEQTVAGEGESRECQETPIVPNDVDAPASTTISVADAADAASSDVDIEVYCDAVSGMDTDIVAEKSASNDTHEKAQGWLRRTVSFFGWSIHAVWNAVAGDDEVKISPEPLVYDEHSNLLFPVASDDWGGGLCI